ncbi:hypothetical protein HRI_000916500 [Hibiscus trionum]|uniref:Reverse transcriptase domain-containing protein n=1 Tax=Hibiscus trionum TaxID=183268 RepID=A0A9W7H7L1_HIBTR|nr:hypothetical protein HRI_000916500 [Hibiscus trionum]
MKLSILSWNIRGVRRKEKIRAVRKVIKKNKPKIIFLQETKLESISAKLVKAIWNDGVVKSAFSPALGSAGGLLCLWDSNFFHVTDCIVHQRFIALIGNMGSNLFSCGLLNVYGPSVDAEKSEFLSDILQFLENRNLPWCIGGDWNVFLDPAEKLGFSLNTTLIDLFRNFVHDAELIDLPLQGGKFTWSNNRDPPTFVRLDRFLVSSDFSLNFSNIVQRLLGKALSDHNAIFLFDEAVNWGPKPFKIFNFWFEEVGFEDTVRQALVNLKSKNSSLGIGGLIRGSKNAVKKWAAKLPSATGFAINKLEAEISLLESSLQEGRGSSDSILRLRTLRSSLWCEYRKEESYWLQKSRLRWFTEGDRNTRFFHLSTSHRRKTNAIEVIKVNGSSVTDPGLIKKAVKDHFDAAYNTKHALELVDFSLNFNRISEAQANALTRRFSCDVVWAALFTSDSNRAPGPDGCNLGFFKKFWPLLKNDIMHFFDEFHCERDWEAGINHSFITLIPKVDNPESLDEFRPISLVGGMYKILSKVLTSRLKSVIGELIGKSQFAFIAGRQILDCSFIANEVIDYMNKEKKEGIAFKIDFQKAYDSVNWDFLMRTMSKCGFNSKWCNWISRCISSASISVLVNGAPTDAFSISRGLRQGCSLSPLLFNLIGEALSLMLSKAVDKGLFSGLGVGCGDHCTFVSHLQFADDLLIFCEAAAEQVKNVKRVLRVFELASGLKINLSKSKIFGLNVDSSSLIAWANSVGCSIGQFPSSYLGLPLGVNRNSPALWAPVINKFEKKLGGWQSNLLSIGGRVILIKSILASLPIYFLSLFRMPKAISNRLNGLMARFLWGGSSEKSKIHWVKWIDVCKPKEIGGLDILDLDTVNRALLGKWSESTDRSKPCGRPPESSRTTAPVEPFAATLGS